MNRARIAARLASAGPLVATLVAIVAFFELFVIVTGEPEYVPPLHKIVWSAVVFIRGCPDGAAFPCRLCRCGLVR